MALDISAALARTMGQLQEQGLLLLSDPRLPSVTTLVTGAPVRGSWWAHRQAHAIFQVNCLLADHADVLFVKLISHKVTLVHRSHWTEVLAIGMAKDKWQMAGLNPSARSLLRQVVRAGIINTADRTGKSTLGTPAPGNAVRALEERLLIYSEQFHSESGKHAKRLEDWTHWKERVGYRARLPNSERARQRLEDLLGNLNRQCNAAGTLPWQER